MKNIVKIVCAVVLSVGATACSQNTMGQVSSGEVRTLQEAHQGVVVRVRHVTIEGSSGTTGMVIGGVSGAVLGSQIGGGSGRIVGGVAGGLLGGAAGSRIDQNVTRQPGFEITVRLDKDRREVVIVQEADQSFSPGDRVTVITSGNSARVTR